MKARAKLLNEIENQFSIRDGGDGKLALEHKLQKIRKEANRKKT